MDSKRIVPDRSAPHALFARAGGITGIVWVLLTLSGCPFREKEIRVTETGAQALVSACFPPMGGGGFGSGFGGGGNPQPPPGGGGGGMGDACTLAGHYPPDFKNLPPQARLLLISPSDQKIRDASKCMHLKPCADSGRYGGPQPGCIASDFNQQLDGAMPGGLSFAGLKNSEDAQLVIAFYSPSDSSEDDEGCHRADLFACAGLAPPLGGGAYDITCASCQYGSRTAYGSNTGPCPKGPTTDSCFLKVCDALLTSNNYE